MTAESPLPSVPPPTKPPTSRRRVGGVFLGIAISVALSFAFGFALVGIEEAFELRIGRYLTLGLAFAGPQILVAVPLAVWLWRKDLKATAMSLAISSALLFLASGACWGLILWG